AGYHMVEESLITAKVQLELKGEHQTGFHYFVRKDSAPFTDGEVREHELSDIPKLALPPGNYTIEAVSVGYGTTHPVQFSVKSAEQTVVLPLELVPNRILLITRTKPAGVAQGRKAILRRLDPVKMKEVWHQEIDIDSNPIALSEGQYVLEFPQVDGYTSPGGHGVTSRFELTANDHSKTVVGDYLNKSGELMVTLQTCEAVQDHLGMVGVTLIGPDGTHQSYPRPGDHVDTSIPTKRSLVVPDLQPGIYTLEFDIDPRTFWLPSARKITVTPERVTKVLQDLTPNPGGVTAKVVLPASWDHSKEAPRITLRDSTGNFLRRSSGAELSINDLPPGEYELVFEHAAGFESPSPIDFRVRPGEIEGPYVVKYEEGSGALVVTLSTGPHGERLPDAQIVLSDQKHRRYTFPGDTQYSSESKMLDVRTRQVVVQDLPAGVYSLECKVPNYDNLFVDVPSQMVVINKGRVARVHQEIEARYGSVEAYAKLPAGAPSDHYPTISLRNHFGEVKATSSNGKLLVHDLKPGNYQLVFADADEWAAPAPVPVLVEPLQSAGPFYGEYTPKTGTMVVNYSTGSRSERLDKVRFWVSDEKGFREMYPKEDAVIVNPESRMRSVVIEDLPQGNYTVQFLLPNADGLFASIPDRHVTITKGHVAEFTQQITPRYGMIEAMIEALPDDPSFLSYPKISVKDQYDAVITESWSGSLLADDLPPGEYWVHFQAVDNYEAPEPVRVVVEAGRMVPPVHVRYAASKGTLVVLYDTDPKPEFLTKVDVKVIDLRDGQPVNMLTSKEERFGAGRRLTLPKLPVGRYLVNFSVPSSPQLFPETVSREIQVKRDEIAQVSQQLRPTYGGLEASVNMASNDYKTQRVPRIFVQDYSGSVVAQSETGHLLATELPPGKYQVIYEQLDSYLSPSPLDVRVSANDISGPFIGQYTLNSGRIVVNYKTGANAEHLDKVRFWITDGANFRRMYPFGEEYRDNPETGTRTVVVDDLPLGNYSLEFFVPEIGELFADVPEQQFSVKAGKTVEVWQDFQPQYGKVTAYLDLPKAAIEQRRVPKITLRDGYQRVQKESSTGVLEVNDLIPGEYLLCYEALEDCVSPDPVKVKIAPDTTVGPFIGKYDMRTGTLVVDYGTGPKQERLDRVRFWLIGEQNHRTMYPTSQVAFAQDPNTGRRRVEIPDLPEGNYRIEFLVPNADNLFSQVPRRDVRIHHGEVTHLTQEIVPHYGGVDVSLTFPQRQVGGLVPQIYLKDRVGKVLTVSEDGHLSTRELAPGRYEIAFEEVQGYETPKSLMVDIAPEQVAGPFFGVYNLAVGAMVVNYDTGSYPKYLDKVRFWVVNEQNSGAMYPQGENFIDDKDKLQRKVIIPDLPEGEYRV
ncbi:MAG: hypothetical protein KDK78_05635, partial [Chlamydiia bacterium]|nr:hypothetical protein [Chlamydiia bacterium]